MKITRNAVFLKACHNDCDSGIAIGIQRIQPHIHPELVHPISRFVNEALTFSPFLRIMFFREQFFGKLSGKQEANHAVTVYQSSDSWKHPL